MTSTSASEVRIPWHRRMEARVTAGVALLVALSVSAMLLATIRAVTDQLLTRAARDLDVGRATFVRSLSARADAAEALTRLVAELPVFRAHLTDTRLRGDRESVTAMADAYRRELRADFSIVSDAGGLSIGTPGLPIGAAPPAEIEPLIARATGGEPQHDVVAFDSRLFLVVVEPVRFAEEVLGTLAVAYALDDRVASDLAAQTHGDVSLLAGGGISGSSLAEDSRRDLERTLRVRTETTAGEGVALWAIGQERYVAGVFPLSSGTGANRLVLLQPWRPTEQFLAALRTRFLGAGVAVFAAAMIGALAFSRRTSRPLRDIAAAAGEIAEGRWDRQVPVEGSAEAATLAVAFNHMSTSLRGAQERLLHDAFHDHLTELPNRALFLDRLRQAIVRRDRHPDRGFAVLFIDLDRFKTVNDSMGHPAGDRLLLETSSRLTSVLRHHDTTARATPLPARSHTLARVGGDEFTVLLEDIRDPSDAVRVAERLQSVIAAPVSLDGHVVFPTASIGIAVSSPGLQSGDDLVRDADTAMYRAKSAGGDRCAVFDATMHQRAVDRLQLESDLRHAFDRQEFVLLYQPIVRLSNGAVVGFEALLRWNHPERGTLDPSAFLRVAEETGLMPRIDDWALRQACRDACAWQRRPREMPITVSVNVSGQGFGRGDLVRQVSSMIAEGGIDPRMLRLEVTESVAMADAERAGVVLAELKALGVRISLDDFGTGYSSLSYLQRLPVDTLKIDRSFVVAMEQNAECREIVRTVLNLAATLDLEAIAEGAETAREIDELVALGCEFAQGYYFSVPLPFDEALELSIAEFVPQPVPVASERL